MRHQLVREGQRRERPHAVERDLRALGLLAAPRRRRELAVPARAQELPAGPHLLVAAGEVGDRRRLEVHEQALRAVDDAQAGVPCPQAQVDVLDVHLEHLVEAAELLVDVAAQEHAGSGHGRVVPLHQRGPELGRLVPVDVERKPIGVEGDAGVLEAAVRVEEAAADDARPSCPRRPRAGPRASPCPGSCRCSGARRSRPRASDAPRLQALPKPRFSPGKTARRTPAARARRRNAAVSSVEPLSTTTTS